MLRWQHVVPVRAQRIAMPNVRCADERNAGVVRAEFVADHAVHLMVGEPHGDLRDLRGEFFDFYAVELINVDCDTAVNVQKSRTGAAVDGAQNVQLQQAQFTISDDEKITATAGDALAVDAVNVEKLRPERLRCLLGGASSKKLLLQPNPRILKHAKPRRARPALGMP